MKTAAVICEYNPFHTGHAYMLRTLRSRCGFDRILCVMSGCYVQRGEPAVFDKYLRAEAALLAGADLVLELPAGFSTSSAGEFAKAAVSMILKTGVCTHVCFGTEPGITLPDLETLRKTAEDKELMKELLRQGYSYPKALALSTGSGKIPPNTRLAAEYLNALEILDPSGSLQPFLLERKGDGYDAAVPSGTGYASASALRNLIYAGNRREASVWMPYSTGREAVCTPDSLTDLLNDRLLRDPDLSSYLDVSREIADRLARLRYTPASFSERVGQLWTKQYTRSRISRALLHIVLGIRTEQTDRLRENGYVPYFRVLGYRTDSGLLSLIKDRSDLPVYTKNARFYEAFPDALYVDQIWHNVTGTGTELTRSPVIL